MKIPKTQPSSVLPEEIIEEILFRLDVKSLLRFRCVSKSCRSLIDSERFIKTHLQKATTDTTFSHHSVLLFSDAYSYKPASYSGEAKASRCSLVSFLDNSDNPNNKPNIFPTNLPPYNKIYVVGCCNGLVCILLQTNTYIAQFILWNPSTGISKKLPELNKIECSYLKCYGFGWDESSDDYKVICVEESQSAANLYSLKSDSWKQIDGWDMNLLLTEFGMFANGKLYWENPNENRDSDLEGEIVAFDLKHEVFESVCYHSEFPLILGTFGDCLAMMFLDGDCFDKIWVRVMKKESWENTMIVHYTDVQRGVIWTCPSVAAKGDDITLMNFQANLSYLAYDLKNDCLRYAGRGTDLALVYVQSLISPYRV